jgi:cytidine deaminase
MAITPAMTAQTVSVFAADMNPLKPCGACTEWLKKIAEVNPAFKVLSFTDADCKGFYCESIFDE